MVGSSSVPDPGKTILVDCSSAPAAGAAGPAAVDPEPDPEASVPAAKGAVGGSAAAEAPESPAPWLHADWAAGAAGESAAPALGFE